MSRIVRLAAAATVIALTATITAIIANDGRDAPQQRSDRYALSLDPARPVITGSSRGATVQAQGARYRLNLAGNTVTAVGPRPTCHYVTWKAATTATDQR
jgi:hypothetical protein